MSENNDDTMYSPCPRCGAAVEDCDGFGVLFHPACGYCKHPAKTDGVCGLCGKEVGFVSKHVYSVRPGRDWEYCERCGMIRNADKETKCRGLVPTVTTRDPLWPVGSLQWASGKSKSGWVRRQSWPLSEKVNYWASPIHPLDLMALDWEICDGGGK